MSAGGTPNATVLLRELEVACARIQTLEAVLLATREEVAMLRRINRMSAGPVVEADRRRAIWASLREAALPISDGEPGEKP